MLEIGNRPVDGQGEAQTEGRVAFAAELNRLQQGQDKSRSRKARAEVLVAGSDAEQARDAAALRDALHMAVRSGDRQKALNLLAAGASPFTGSEMAGQGENEAPDLIFAAANGDLDIVRAMLEPLPPGERARRINERGPGGNTALHAAYFSRNVELQQYLRSQGGRLAVANDGGQRPDAIPPHLQKRFLGLVAAGAVALGGLAYEALLIHTAKPPERMPSGMGSDTASNLLDAVSSARLDDVERLLDAPPRGFDINATNEAGQTALHLALAGDSPADLVSLLVRHGADVAALDGNGKSPFHLVLAKARSSGELQMQQLAQSLQDDLTRDLRQAIYTGNEDRALDLIEAGANVQGRFANWASFVGVAAFAGMARVVDALLKALPQEQRAAAVNATDERGNTAAHWASAGGHREALDMLLEAGGNATALNADGRTAPDLWHPLVQRSLDWMDMDMGWGFSIEALGYRSSDNLMDFDGGSSARSGLADDSLPNDSGLVPDLADDYELYVDENGRLPVGGDGQPPRLDGPMLFPPEDPAQAPSREQQATALVETINRLTPELNNALILTWRPEMGRYHLNGYDIIPRTDQSQAEEEQFVVDVLQAMARMAGHGRELIPGLSEEQRARADVTGRATLYAMFSANQPIRIHQSEYNDYDFDSRRIYFNAEAGLNERGVEIDPDVDTFASAENSPPDVNLNFVMNMANFDRSRLPGAPVPMVDVANGAAPAAAGHSLGFANSWENPASNNQYRLWNRYAFRSYYRSPLENNDVNGAWAPAPRPNESLPPFAVPDEIYDRGVNPAGLQAQITMIGRWITKTFEHFEGEGAGTAFGGTLIEAGDTFYLFQYGGQMRVRYVEGNGHVRLVQLRDQMLGLLSAVQRPAGRNAVRRHAAFVEETGAVRPQICVGAAAQVRRFPGGMVVPAIVPEQPVGVGSTAADDITLAFHQESSSDVAQAGDMRAGIAIADVEAMLARDVRDENENEVQRQIQQIGAAIQQAYDTQAGENEPLDLRGDLLIASHQVTYRFGNGMQFSALRKIGNRTRLTVMERLRALRSQMALVLLLLVHGDRSTGEALRQIDRLMKDQSSEHQGHFVIGPGEVVDRLYNRVYVPAAPDMSGLDLESDEAENVREALTLAAKGGGGADAGGPSRRGLPEHEVSLSTPQDADELLTLAAETMAKRSNLAAGEVLSLEDPVLGSNMRSLIQYHLFHQEQAEGLDEGSRRNLASAVDRAVADLTDRLGDAFADRATGERAQELFQHYLQDDGASHLEALAEDVWADYLDAFELTEQPLNTELSQAAGYELVTTIEDYKALLSGDEGIKTFYSYDHEFPDIIRFHQEQDGQIVNQGVVHEEATPEVAARARYERDFQDKVKNGDIGFRELFELRFREGSGRPEWSDATTRVVDDWLKNDRPSLEDLEKLRADMLRVYTTWTRQELQAVLDSGVVDGAGLGLLKDTIIALFYDWDFSKVPGEAQFRQQYEDALDALAVYIAEPMKSPERRLPALNDEAKGYLATIIKYHFFHLDPKGTDRYQTSQALRYHYGDDYLFKDLPNIIGERVENVFGRGFQGDAANDVVQQWFDDRDSDAHAVLAELIGREHDGYTAYANWWHGGPDSPTLRLWER